MGTTGVRHKRTGTTPSRHAHGLSAFRSASDLKTAVVSSFNMGLISPPIQYTLMQKIPSYAMIFYTLAFSAGAMDSMLQMMMGTTDEALPIVMSPQMDAMFVGFGLCNAVIAALLYPQSFSSKE